MHAELRNTALGLAFKPPAGRHWTREMLMPGYAGSSRPEEYDWRAEKAKMNMIGKRPDPEKRKEQARARAEHLASMRDRQKQAEEAKQRGASPAEIRQIMES